MLRNLTASALIFATLLFHVLAINSGVRRVERPFEALLESFKKEAP
jgi:hypothetical protein